LPTELLLLPQLFHEASIVVVRARTVAVPSVVEDFARTSKPGTFSFDRLYWKTVSSGTMIKAPLHCHFTFASLPKSSFSMVVVNTTCSVSKVVIILTNLLFVVVVWLVSLILLRFLL
jgi:hypothetical protein